jgi:hypothetical protein
VAAECVSAAAECVSAVEAVVASAAVGDTAVGAAGESEAGGLESIRIVMS